MPFFSFSMRCLPPVQTRQAERRTTTCMKDDQYNKENLWNLNCCWLLMDSWLTSCWQLANNWPKNSQAYSQRTDWPKVSQETPTVVSEIEYCRPTWVNRKPTKFPTVTQQKIPAECLWNVWHISSVFEELSKSSIKWIVIYPSVSIGWYSIGSNLLHNNIFLLCLSITCGLWTSTPTNDLRVLLLSIIFFIITVTTGRLQKLQKLTQWIENCQSQHTSITFWPCWA